VILSVQIPVKGMYQFEVVEVRFPLPTPVAEHPTGPTDPLISLILAQFLVSPRSARPGRFAVEKFSIFILY
jgi:hypothetical protein